MGVTKLATMAFIKDKHDFLVFKIGDIIAVMVFGNGVIELL